MLKSGFYAHLLTQNWYFVLLALIGFLVILASTPCGAATSPDSFTYLSTARNLLAGEGYTRFNGQAFTLWPPLFPTLLAGIYGLADLAGVAPDMMALLRIINALTFAVTIIATGFLFRRQFRQGIIAILALGAILTGYPMVDISTFIWSEGLFILLNVLFFLLLDEYRTQPSPRILAGLIVVAALASLQRYPGALLILAGGIVLFLITEQPIRQRAQHAILFGGSAGLPLLVWLVHNYVRADTLTGKRPDSSLDLRTNISQTLNVMVRWFTPERFGISNVAITIIGGLMIAFWLARSYRGGMSAAWQKHLEARWWPMALFVVFYIAFMILSATRVHFDTIDDRLLAPVYVFVIALAFLLIEALLGWVETRYGHRLLTLIIIGAAGIWLLYPITRLRDEITTLQNYSNASREAERAQHNSSLMKRIREADLDGPVYTNAPLPVLLHSDLTVKGVPLDLADWSPDVALLVWFDEFPPCNLTRRHCILTDYTPADLTGHIVPEPLLTADDGAVYSLQEGQK